MSARSSGCRAHFQLQRQRLPTALLLTQICRVWREIGFQIPQIWALFRIDVDDWPKDHAIGRDWSICGMGGEGRFIAAFFRLQTARYLQLIDGVVRDISCDLCRLDAMAECQPSPLLPGSHDRRNSISHAWKTTYPGNTSDNHRQHRQHRSHRFRASTLPPQCYLGTPKPSLDPPPVEPDHPFLWAHIHSNGLPIRFAIRRLPRGRQIPCGWQRHGPDGTPPPISLSKFFN
ncbi:hypothetical protein K438DRAFT_59333 [Mycena galopus ATCC 62051]|nr:hypothetical protein K438DRAFT_59333 [Mycena galopus ATCC 62051]